MSKRAIPKQLYATFKEEIHYDVFQDLNGNWVRGGITTRNVIGFVQAYDKSVAGQKRMKTQMDWAYPNRVDTIAELQAALDDSINGMRNRYSAYTLYFLDGANSLLYKPGEYDSSANRYGPGEIVPFAQDLVPQLWDNVPVRGFKVCGFKSRYSTSNKLILVEDPRGGQFEVKVDSFVDLMSEVSIVNGVIQDECIWVGNKVLEKY
jgi:hypothetical protein